MKATRGGVISNLPVSVFVVSWSSVGINNRFGPSALSRRLSRWVALVSD